MRLYYFHEMTEKQINYLEALGFEKKMYHCQCGSCTPEMVMELEKLPEAMTSEEFLRKFVYTPEGEIREV